VTLSTEIELPVMNGLNDRYFNDWERHVRDFFYIREPNGGRILYVSPAYEGIWGRTVESLYQDPSSWRESIHPEDHDRVVQAASSNNGTQDDYRIVKTGGEVRWIRSRSYPVMGDFGEVARIVGFAEDITEWKRLEQQLVQSQKLDAVGRLAGGIAHDFNNLLTVINGYSALLEEREDLSEMVRADIVSIHNAGKRAAQLTGQLLAFSRKQPLKLKSMNLTAAVTEVEPILRRLIREDVDLVIAPSPSELCVCADATQIEQVLLNLVINARDAIEGKGTITIETREEYFDAGLALMHPGCSPGRYAMLAVSDNGHGMDAETQDRIFEPFFTTKPEGRGTGLGLATVYGVVKQSGGSIWVYSEVGIGTTFRVYLPISSAEKPEPPNVRPPRKAQAGTGLVLMVEDDDQVRAIASAALKSRGYDVVSAENGEEALKIAAKISGPLDMLVTDVIMPKMGGPELVAKLVPGRPELRVLFISGYTENSLIPASTVPAGVQHLPKPFTPNMLAQKVNEMMSR